MVNQPVEWVEIDLDYCANTFGVGGCTAALGVGGCSRKCFNTFFTCYDKENFNAGTKTYKFFKSMSYLPKGATVFPALLSVSARSATANIAGADKTLDALGKRATIDVEIADFTYHDGYCDKYWTERESGAAQLSGVGYDPFEFGTFLTRLKARNPNYANRPIRHCTGYINLDSGELTTEVTRHFIMTNWEGVTNSRRLKISGKDILDLANKDRAVIPQKSRGKLQSDIDEAYTGTVSIGPSGIGDAEYPSSGYAALGNEMVSYTRSGDVITITGRGLKGTGAKSQKVDTVFQTVYSVDNVRIDAVIRDILLEAGIDSAFIPFSDWQSDVDRWMPGMMLSTDIMTPTGASDLIGEIAVLGVTVWWDDTAQEIKLEVNKPLDGVGAIQLSDDLSFMSITQDDRDSERLTEIIFNLAQIDPSSGISDDNFSTSLYLIDGESKIPAAYGDRKIDTINCRWLNHGDQSSARIAALRLLNRFKRSPTRWDAELDWRDNLEIGDVVEITTETDVNDIGESKSQLAQVVAREDVKAGHSLKVTMQRFQFDERYGYFTDNSRPSYNASTQAQRDRGAYWSSGDNLFSDGGKTYRFS